ncbi:MAG: DEAD/DEAH box helicase [Oligoflexia bacterium]|nr:DEAD/DEAH box helicase [Oligoflexia bacterium]
MKNKTSASQCVKPKNSTARVVNNVFNFYAKTIHPKVAMITTPYPKTIPLQSLNFRLPSHLVTFISRYEKKTITEGLYQHQVEFLSKYLENPTKDFILTSATSSGKSLCFWSWILDQLTRDPEATALLCFPTQALMWGQARRIAEVSEKWMIDNRDNKTPYGGTLTLNSKKIDWSIWKGQGSGCTEDVNMINHTRTKLFKNARIRIATIDKSHYSLLKVDKKFSKKLSCIVLDEAHIYDGTFGANVHYFLARVFMARELSSKSRPQVFLASATLGNALKFAGSLIPHPSVESVISREAIDKHDKTDNHKTDNHKIDNLEKITFDQNSIIWIKDHNEQIIKMVSKNKSIELLNNPPTNALMKAVLFLDAEKGDVDANDFLLDPKLLGRRVNTICFVEDKFYGKYLNLRLKNYKPSEENEENEENKENNDGCENEESDNNSSVENYEQYIRQTLVYDADLPPTQRRNTENFFNSCKREGFNLIATSSLELGVDIKGLGVCLMNDLPILRQDLLQRIGRVARSSGHPGVVILKAPLTPQGRALLKNPASILRLDSTYSHAIPTYLEMIRSRHMIAAYQEGMLEEYAKGDEKLFIKMMNKYFGHFPGLRNLMTSFASSYGSAISMQGRYWAHVGFRGNFDGGSQIPLIDQKTMKDVAWINRDSLMRDAHPEGIYLDHKGLCWRVVAYQEEWQSKSFRTPLKQQNTIMSNPITPITPITPINEDSSVGVDVDVGQEQSQVQNPTPGPNQNPDQNKIVDNSALQKWCTKVKSVYVMETKAPLSTRGDWIERYEFYSPIDPIPPEITLPKEGEITFGMWNFYKKWNGYKEINLKTGVKKFVPLAAVTSRFKQAINSKEAFPYLHPISFRTFGWQWCFGKIIEEREELDKVIEGICIKYLLSVLECKNNDITFRFSSVNQQIVLFDSVIGGNGLSSAVLQDGRFIRVLSDIIMFLESFNKSKSKQNIKRFTRYMQQFLNKEMDNDIIPMPTPAELINIFEQIHSIWTGIKRANEL